MKICTRWFFSVVLICTTVPAAAAAPARIDGTSEASFDASFAKLVRSLKAPERRTLALGLFGTLLPRECLAPEAIIHLTFSPVGPKDGPRVRPCREHLHGMSYQDILDAGEAPASPHA